jgi:hypothetical protein
VLDSLLADNQQISRAGYSTAPAVLEKRIVDAYKSVWRMPRQDTANYLRALARQLLQERRDVLTNYLGETYLGLERVESKVAPAPKESSGKS